MDLSGFVLPGIFLLLGVNQVAARVGALARIPGLVWSVNLGNVAVAGYALFLGLPSFEHVRPASWMIGLLLLMHTAKNIQAQTDRKLAEREERRLQEETDERERLRLREKEES